MISRYSRKELTNIWSEENKYKIWLDVEIAADDLGQPTVNGKPVLKFRIEKNLPDEKKSKKTLEAEKNGI